MLTHPITADPVHQFAADVRTGLTCAGQKELPSKYLYDAVGSALFEVISLLPEYGLTRADERLLRTHAPDIVERLPRNVVVAELGSGSAKKTRWILQALASRQETRYCPIEISPAALAMCARELGDLEAISIVGFEREYLDGLAEVGGQLESGERLVVLFLGSTIGNFDRPADMKFLRQVRHILQTGDCLLLGTDLAKPVDQLIAAYDDKLGVTAAFNLNLLERINRELDANFLLEEFEHIAKYNPSSHSIEMHIGSMRKQTVTIPAADLCVDFESGETIWTESSHKYSPSELLRLAMGAGFRVEAQWIDQQWPFAETLLVAI